MKIIKNCLLLILFYSNLFAQDGKTIAVIGLDAVGISKTEAQVISNRIRSILVNKSRFRVLERANMDEVLNEQGFQQSGCTSDECLVEAGQLLGVQKMLAGSVGKFGTVYTIDLRIIDVETGNIESSATYDYRGEMENLLLEGTPAALTALLKLDVERSKKADNPKAYLQIITNVPDALIRVNTNIIGYGRTNIISLKPGSQNISVQQKYYLSFLDVVQTSVGDTSILSIQLVRAEGLLKLSGLPEKTTYAIANLNGINKGFDQLILPAGEHELKLYASNYYPLNQVLDLVGDTTITINYNLKYGGNDLINKQNRHKWLVAGSLTSLGLTIASALLAEFYHNKYQDAETSDDASKYKDLTKTFDQTTKVFAGITITVSAFTLWNWLSTNSLKRELHVP